MNRKKKSAKRTKIQTLREVAENKPKTGYWEKAKSFYRPIKQPITLRLDADVIDWYKRGGRGYQTRINRALRELMELQKKRK